MAWVPVPKELWVWRCDYLSPTGQRVGTRTQFLPIKSHSLNGYPLPLPHPSVTGTATPRSRRVPDPHPSLPPRTHSHTHRTLHLAKAWPGGPRRSIHSPQLVGASLCDPHDRPLGAAGGSGGPGQAWPPGAGSETAGWLDWVLKANQG